MKLNKHIDSELNVCIKQNIYIINCEILVQMKMQIKDRRKK